MSIAKWPVEMRPREKLLKFGANSLSDAELLAIFLRVGVKGKSAIDLAYEIIQHFNGLHNTFSANMENFSKIKGLGLAKYTQMQACLEMSKRVLATEITHYSLDCSSKLLEYLKLTFTNLQDEHLICICLGSEYQVLKSEIIAKGNANFIHINIRDLIKLIMLNNAQYIVLAHNHPNGDINPSNEDINVTQKIIAALAYIQVTILDHIIISHNKSYSMKQAGLI